MLAKFLRILANLCESVTNKANGLRFFFFFFFFLHFLENALRMGANCLPVQKSNKWNAFWTLSPVFKTPTTRENRKIDLSSFHTSLFCLFRLCGLPWRSLIIFFNFETCMFSHTYYLFDPFSLRKLLRFGSVISVKWYYLTVYELTFNCWENIRYIS